MNAKSESNTPSIDPTSINPTSMIKPANTNPSNPTSTIITDVIQEIGKKIDEMPKESSNPQISKTSNTHTSNPQISNSNRFFRDVGKKNPITANPITANPITTTANPITTTVTAKPISNETSESKGPSYKELKEISKNNWRAYIETGLIGSLFGSTPAYVIHYVNLAVSLMFKLFILFIIFNICVVIHNAIQMGLDLFHTLMGGVKKSLSDVNNLLNQIGFDFVIPGVRLDINALGIHWNSGDIAHINWYPFTDSLGGPLGDVQSAINAIPRKALDVIIDMILDMFNGIIDLAPKILEGIINLFEKIMK